MAYAHELLAEGREQGLEEGMQQGMQQGMQRGMLQGVQRGKVETVEGFLKAGATWEMIESATGLDEAGFRALKERLAADTESK